MTPNRTPSLIFRVPRRSAIAPAPGMSLLELLVVIALMAVIAGLVLPTFGDGVSTSQLKASARQLAAGLRVARSEAVSHKRESFLMLDLEGRRFKLDSDPREYALPPRVELKLFTAQRDIVNDTTGAIRFCPDGGSNGGRITVASGERKFEVDVDWLTGRVAILD
jgi:general secretion pathway protein H